MPHSAFDANDSASIDITDLTPPSDFDYYITLSESFISSMAPLAKETEKKTDAKVADEEEKKAEEEEVVEVKPVQLSTEDGQSAHLSFKLSAPRLVSESLSSDERRYHGM